MNIEHNIKLGEAIAENPDLIEFESKLIDAWNFA